MMIQSVKRRRVLPNHGKLVFELLIHRQPHGTALGMLTEELAMYAIPSCTSSNEQIGELLMLGVRGVEVGIWIG